MREQMEIKHKPGERELIFPAPVCTENIWGGSRLRDEFGCEGAGAHTGECWGISAHPAGDGTVKNGRYAGGKLSAVWKNAPELFGGFAADRFPLLIKIIDAKEDLSIQVHPDDAYAMSHENGSLGKTECWYILDCTEDATIVIGHAAKTREELSERIAKGEWQKLLCEIPVRPGDFIQIDPGTVHAIRGGCLLLETQQSSDVTYRLYDYDRLWNGRPRELHLEKCMDVITVPAVSPERCVIHTPAPLKNVPELLYRCAYYRIFRLAVKGECTVSPEDLGEEYHPFLAVSVVDGAGAADGHPVRKGDHFIVPHGYGDLTFSGELTMIASEPGEEAAPGRRRDPKEGKRGGRQA